MMTLAVALSPMLISITAFVSVTGMLVCLVLLFSNRGTNKVEDRLSTLAARTNPTVAAVQDSSSVTRNLYREDVRTIFATLSKSLLERFGSMKMLFIQADVPIKPDQFVMLMCGSAVAFIMFGLIANVPTAAYPLCGIAGFLLPIGYLMFSRGQRFKRFAKQLPDAMELIARALRSGHSLNTALKVVVDELPEPISKEFNIAYEEQNLGIPIEQALKNLYLRVPNMDYKFFAMAVAIQRQSGGDLAEILDKIGHIIRERFRILGQVQALTGEGRISGVVLMALPIALFFAVWYLNEEYVMLLFTDELGKQMVAGAIFLQVLGAYTIKKIIAIKV